jgi:hypothetical protein
MVEVMNASRVRRGVVLTALVFVGGLFVLVAETRCGSVFAPDLTLAFTETPRGQFIADCHDQLAWRQVIGWASLVGAGIVATASWMRRRQGDAPAETTPERATFRRTGSMDDAQRPPE